jgi:pentatricopeptide repeat protein
MMQQHGVKPDQIVFNHMIEAHSRSSEYESSVRMAKLVEQMRAEGIPLNATTYNSLLLAYADQRNAAMAVRCLEEMRTVGQTPTLLSVNKLLSGLVNKRRLSRAETVLSAALATGMQADIFTYNIMISGYAGAGMPDKATVDPHAIGRHRAKRCHLYHRDQDVV